MVTPDFYAFESPALHGLWHLVRILDAGTCPYVGLVWFYNISMNPECLVVIIFKIGTSCRRNMAGELRANITLRYDFYQIN